MPTPPPHLPVLHFETKLYPGILILGLRRVYQVSQTVMMSGLVFDAQLSIRLCNSDSLELIPHMLVCRIVRLHVSDSNVLLVFM